MRNLRFLGHKKHFFGGILESIRGKLYNSLFFRLSVPGPALGILPRPFPACYTVITMERFNPLNDYLFLKLMGEEGDEEQCLVFLNAVLGSKNKQPVKLIRILENKTFTAEVIGEKSSILDVRVETDSGEKVNIEVQLKDLHNMEKRTLMHWGREFTTGIYLPEATTRICPK